MKFPEPRIVGLMDAENLSICIKTAFALHEAIRLMQESDAVIDTHGGWPGAFTTGQTANQ